MLTRKAIDSLFQLTDNPGLSLDVGWGGLVVRLANYGQVNYSREGEFIFLTVTPSVRLDSGVNLLAGATDGFLNRIRFERDGSAYAYVEIKGPLGYVKTIEKRIEVTE